MSILTDNEKISLIDWGLPWESGIPLSPAAINQAVKQQLIWGYAGILWGSPVVVCPTTVFTDRLLDDIDEVFLNTEEFAIVGTYTTATGVTFDINGIFDAAYIESNPEVTMGLQSIGPMFKCSLQNILDNGGCTDVKQGDIIAICGIEYQIVESHPDGLGLTNLILHKY